MRTLFDYATIVALSIGYAAVVAGSRPLAFMAFTATLACGVAATILRNHEDARSY